MPFSKHFISWLGGILFPMALPFQASTCHQGQDNILPPFNVAPTL